MYSILLLFYVILNQSCDIGIALLLTHFKYQETEKKKLSPVLNYKC